MKTKIIVLPITVDNEFKRWITFPMHKWLFYSEIKLFQNLYLVTIWLLFRHGMNFFGVKVAFSCRKQKKSEPFGSDFLVDDTRLECFLDYFLNTALSQKALFINTLRLFSYHRGPKIVRQNQCLMDKNMDNCLLFANES